VPALKSRPDMPLWLTPALDCWVDLGGLAPWWRVREWADFHSVDLEWLLPVLRSGAQLLDEHLTKERKQKSGRSSVPAKRRPNPGH